MRSVCAVVCPAFRPVLEALLREVLRACEGVTADGGFVLADYRCAVGIENGVKLNRHIAGKDILPVAVVHIACCGLIERTVFIVCVVAKILQPSCHLSACHGTEHFCSSHVVWRVIAFVLKSARDFGIGHIRLGKKDCRCCRNRLGGFGGQFKSGGGERIMNGVVVIVICYNKDRNVFIFAIRFQSNILNNIPF